MAALYDALVKLSPAQDSELLDGFQRYESLLTAILTPEQLQSYATFIGESGALRVFEELTPAEMAALPPEEAPIALAITADETASMENRRVSSLLNQRGQHTVAPDLGAPHR